MSKVKDLANDLGLLDGRKISTLSSLSKERFQSDNPLVYDPKSGQFIRGNPKLYDTEYQIPKGEKLFDVRTKQYGLPSGSTHGSTASDANSSLKRKTSSKQFSDPQNYARRDVEDYLKPVKHKPKPEEYDPEPVKGASSDTYTAKYVPSKGTTRIIKQETQYGAPINSQSNDAIQYADYQTDYKAAGYESAEAYKKAWDDYYRALAEYEEHQRLQNEINVKSSQYVPDKSGVGSLARQMVEDEIKNSAPNSKRSHVKIIKKESNDGQQGSSGSNPFYKTEYRTTRTINSDSDSSSSSSSSSSSDSNSSDNQNHRGTDQYGLKSRHRIRKVKKKKKTRIKIRKRIEITESSSGYYGEANDFNQKNRRQKPHVWVTEDYISAEEREREAREREARAARARFEQERQNFAWQGQPEPMSFQRAGYENVYQSGYREGASFRSGGRFGDGYDREQNRYSNYQHQEDLESNLGDTLDEEPIHSLDVNQLISSTRHSQGSGRTQSHYSSNDPYNHAYNPYIRHIEQAEQENEAQAYRDREAMRRQNYDYHHYDRSDIYDPLERKKVVAQQFKTHKDAWNSGVADSKQKPVFNRMPGPGRPTGVQPMGIRACTPSGDPMGSKNKIIKIGQINFKPPKIEPEPQRKQAVSVSESVESGEILPNEDIQPDQSKRRSLLPEPPIDPSEKSKWAIDENDDYGMPRLQSISNNRYANNVQDEELDEYGFNQPIVPNLAAVEIDQNQQTDDQQTEIKEEAETETKTDENPENTSLPENTDKQKITDKETEPEPVVTIQKGPVLNKPVTSTSTSSSGSINSPTTPNPIYNPPRQIRQMSPYHRLPGPKFDSRPNWFKTAPNYADREANREREGAPGKAPSWISKDVRAASRGKSIGPPKNPPAF